MSKRFGGTRTTNIFVAWKITDMVRLRYFGYLFWPFTPQDRPDSGNP
ncbi:hypothetical protein F1514_004075 [Yersinia pestis]|nr:hypothetical protein [Yersinia pestis]